MVRSLFLCRDMNTLDSTDEDPIDAVVNNPQNKYRTSCGIRKSLDSFHKDETKEDGRRDTCSECRSKINELKKKDRLDEKLRKIEQEGLETLGNLKSGGSFDPHINEVFEAMMKPFGGVNGWAKHLFATYLASDPGSQKRVKIHDMMEERDLLQLMRSHLVEYQKGNDLPSTAIPTLSGNVIDAEAVEAKDG